MVRKSWIAGALAAGGLVWLVVARLGDGDEAGRGGGRGPAPVEVAGVEHGPIDLRRVFTGTLQAREQFVVAAHVGGRVQRLYVDLADTVEQGQVVAELDDDDEVQGVAEASAELAAARANLADSRSALEIAERELERLVGLEARGVVSASDLDLGRAQHLARRTAVEVAQAQLERATAALARAKIRSGYTSVIATWASPDATRVVAERHVDEGDMVAAGDPLLTIVDLEPIDAIVHVTEREYGQVAAGQPATLTTDAYPGKAFEGQLSRIAPVFSERSRQARMQIEIPNSERLLKPGMFVRAEIVLARAPAAISVPVAALATRDGKTGVFVVDDEGAKVTWRVVDTGIREGNRIQLVGDDIDSLRGSRVVTLGHQLIDDGSAITIPEPAAPAASRDRS